MTGIITNCVIERCANKESSCTFDVINADSDDIANFVAVSPISILCFDGFIFSGWISEVEKIQKNEYSATTPFYVLNVTCRGDYSMFSDVFITKEIAGEYSDKTSGELIEIIVPSEWQGDIETTGNVFLFNVTNESIGTNVMNIIDQTQYDWRFRRDYYRGEVYGSVINGSYYDIEYVDTVNSGTDVYAQRYIYLVSGDGKYLGYGNIVSDVDYGAGGTDHRKLTVLPIGSFDWAGVAADDVFVISMDPVFDYARDLSNTYPVQSYLLNKDIFVSAEKESTLADVTQVAVSGSDEFGIKRTSNLFAAYVQDGVDWDYCTYTTYRDDGILTDEFTITTSNATLTIAGHNFKPTTGDVFYVKFNNGADLYANSYTYVSHSETLDDYGNPITLVTVSATTTYDQNRTYPAGSYALHKRIIVEDTDQFFVGNVMAIGNEGMLVSSKGTVTIDTVVYNYISCTRIGVVTIGDIEFEEGYSHWQGTLVRNCDTYNRYNAQTGSPLDLYYDFTRTLNVSGNVYRGDLDKYATNYLTGRTKFKSRGSGRVVLKDFWKSDSDHDVVGPVPITVGDTIRVYSTSTDYIDYQILAYKANMTKRQVELTLGEYNQNWINLVANTSRSISRTIS